LEDKAIIIGVHETKLSCRIQNSEEDIFITEESIDVPLETWHHVAVTVTPRGRIALFLDGIEMYWTEFPAELPAMDTDIILGASASGEHFFMGDLDEVQLSNMPRSSGWIRALYAAQGMESTLLSYGEEQVGGGGGLPLFYFKVIFKNITLDGWTIISLLIFMSGASWFIFITKAFFIRLTEKENDTFMEEFDGLNSLFKLENQKEEYLNSSLFHLYATGCDSLKSGIENPNPDSAENTLTTKSMNAFKAALEKGFIEESKKLNAWMVVLTMAITGGPFLGLLGTVWGVMNTFAAMAEAGEANIMAIAPGVASALSTTVFGLIVAIPALFSYNYLVSRVKNIAADMTVFIDQFTLKVDAVYGRPE
jgi:biopolymer transport protein ExbB